MPDTPAIDQLAQVIYDALHCNDASVPWARLSSDRRWFYRLAASRAADWMGERSGRVDVGDRRRTRQGRARCVLVQHQGRG